MMNDTTNKKIKTESSPHYPKIQGWGCHGKGEKLVQYTYEPAALLDNDVEIKISHCGICGSDIHTLDSGWGPTNYPAVVGHEIIGTVTAKGKSVTHLELGDRVGVGAQCAACLKEECNPCSIGKDAHCPKMAWTYNSIRAQDKSKTHGGYAEAVRVQVDYVFKIPESIPSEFAAPLMCAGVTVFAPMLRYGLKKGDKVGVIGIGGLGHMAIKFAHALGCEVTAFSHSSNKKEESIKMGTTHFVDTSNSSQLKGAEGTLDFLIVASNANDNDFMAYNTWMKVEARIILVALPESKLQVPPRALTRNDISICGSSIGSIKEINKMLEFAAEHKVYPTIEKFPMTKVNEALQHVRDGKVRYRVVLEN